ncbi:MAG: hypothetical protein H6821_04805 [Planctomycetaceae bacterium]|jgi:hypothetical protein|nr:hypothetical protein [Planctomycetaceae bacterium]
MADKKSACPDCQGQMHPIKLLDATHPGLHLTGARHVETTYAAVDAPPSLFTGTIPKAGTVKARICQECGRIILHGSRS